VAFTEMLDDLIDSSRPLRMGRLVDLTSLDPDERQSFAMVWPRVETERRRAVVRDLVDLAEDNIDLNFDAIFFTALDDADALVRASAIQGLWEYEEKDLIEPLVRLMDSDPDEGVQAAAATALGKFVVRAEFQELRRREVDRVVGALRSTIGSRESPLEVRARALESLGAHSQPWVTDVIQRAYEGDSHRMVVSSLHAMGRSCDSRWLPVLLERLEDGDPEVRYEAAVALGAVGEESAVESLAGLLNDEDGEVQDATIDALGQIGGARAREALRELLRSDDSHVRQAAQEALAQVEFLQDPLFPSREGNRLDGNY
jgi:HEAT repeat protein